MTAVQSIIEEYPTYPLYITGHSLGAGLAVLCALEFQTNNPIVYTFGEPRVGDWDFSQISVALNGFRITHNRDVVVHVPYCPESPKKMASSSSSSFNATAFKGMSLEQQVQRIAQDVGNSGDCYPNSGRESWPNFGYHQPTEIWYRESMPDAFGAAVGVYSACYGQPVGEDRTCSDSIIPESITDHTHYFGIDVGYPAGCS